MISVNGKNLEWREGLTVREMLKEMGYNFPMIVVKVNGKVVKRENWDSHIIPDGAVVDAIHLISGG